MHSLKKFFKKKSTTSASSSTYSGSSLHKEHTDKSSSKNKKRLSENSKTRESRSGSNASRNNDTQQSFASERKKSEDYREEEPVEDEFIEPDDSDDEQPVDEEEEDEGDSFVGGLSFEQEPKEDKEFACLSPEQIISRQEREIKTVADMFCLSPSTSAALLRHYNWKRERLVSDYLEQPEDVCKAAGIALSEIAPSMEKSVDAPVSSATVLPLTGEACCSICAEDVPVTECTALNCLHLFCNDCWKNYLTMKINEGEVTKIKCPQLKCAMAADETTVKKLVSPDIWDKYLRFVTKSFVEHSEGRVKWCPQPNCGNAITADMITGTEVKCTCGYRFCFSCHREAHAPADCDQVKQWEKKCKDDSETTHWKYANTKDCPKCVTPVEKNGGCNHMTCRQCKHEWCWVCIRPWKGHNDYYNCNKFLKQEKRRSTFFSRSSKKEKQRERELEREQNRIALERYLHFFERYMNHSHSGELEKQIRNRALTRMSELQKEASTISEVQYVLEGTEELLECRSVLRYSYVYSYFLPDTGPQKELFEYLQEDLEKTTEQLSEILEQIGTTQIQRLKALNTIQLAKTRKMNLLKAVDQGMLEVV